MPSVQCAQCGHTNPDDARFCSNCGTHLSRDVPPVTDQSGDSTSTMSLSAIEAAVAAESGEEATADHRVVEALPADTAILLVKRGPNAGSRFLLDRHATSAGRHPESDIFLDDVTVSRAHAEFYRQGARFSVRDLGSLNGTYVNRQRIDETALSSGDEVQIGKFRLMYLSSALSDAPARAPEAVHHPRRGWWRRWWR
jgi:FHA domain/zinc-ribbon domain